MGSFVRACRARKQHVVIGQYPTVGGSVYVLGVLAVLGLVVDNLRDERTCSRWER
eukprot:m.202069 g.202069  ORF g.202069 m.202069 type:complete len:55 (-) comp18813_c0_seq1:197-361(-)